MTGNRPATNRGRQQTHLKLHELETAVGTETPERLEGTITVQTDDDCQPTIAIPFYGLISG